MQVLLIIALVSFVSGDVLRTVYCENACNDYLKVPEAYMPLCAPEHHKLNDCGTVITCDLSDVGRDKERPIANTTDFVCCYKTVIKEEGDCDIQHNQVAAPVEVVRTSPHVSARCADPIIPWCIASILLVVVTVQAGYIIWSSLQRPSMQKVMHASEVHCQRPNFQARPLIDTRLSV